MVISECKPGEHLYTEVFSGKMMLVVDAEGIKGIIGGRLEEKHHFMISFTKEELEGIRNVTK